MYVLRSYLHPSNNQNQFHSKIYCKGMETSLHTLFIYLPLLFLATLLFWMMDCLWGKRSNKPDIISDANVNTEPDTDLLIDTAPLEPSVNNDEPEISRVRRSGRIKKNSWVHKNRRQRF